MSKSPSSVQEQRALELVIAEFQFVSGLIPFYRGIETTALGGTGLIVTGIAGALAALEASDSPNRVAEGVLLSAGAWAPVLLLMIELMALTRLRRASAYISQRLHPLAVKLSGQDDILSWEIAPSEHLFKELDRAMRPDKAKEAESPKNLRELLLSRRVVKTWLSSAPLIASIALVSIALAVAGVAIYPNTATWISGGLAAGCAISGAAYGILLSRAIEHRTDVRSKEPSE